MTLWLLVWTIAFLALAGLAIDTTNAYRTRAMLQATVDAAAHAGAVELVKTGSAAGVPARAQTIARLNMPTGSYSEVVPLSDVQIGVWDGSTFSETLSSPNAVRAVARRTSANGNALATNFLRIIGFDDFDVVADSVAVLSRPDCPDDGIFARGQVRFTANNRFAGDVCIHSQTELQISDVDALSTGTRFSVPDIRPHNEGGDVKASSPAYAAIRNNLEEGYYVPRAAHQDYLRARIAAIRSVISEYQVTVAENVVPTRSGNGNGNGNGNSTGTDGGTTTEGGGTTEGSGTGDGGGSVVLSYGYKEVTHGNGGNGWDIQADLDAGYRYFDLTCSQQNATFQLPDGIDLSGVTILSTCAIKANKPVTAYDTLIAVDDYGNSKSLHIIGKSLNATTSASCTDYGSMTLLSTGGIHMTADTNFTGVEIVATGKVKFTANADLTLGLSIQGWDEVEFSANATIDGCGGVPNDRSEFVSFVRIAS